MYTVKTIQSNIPGLWGKCFFKGLGGGIFIHFTVEISSTRVIYHANKCRLYFNLCKKKALKHS